MGDERRWEDYDGSYPVTMRHGFDLYLRPGCTHSERRFRYRVLEANELDVLQDRAFDGFACIDVGANVGYWSRFLLDRVGPDGRVHAFEPDPISAATLRRNLDDPRAVVREQAAGAEISTSILYSDPAQSGLNSTLPFHAAATYRIDVTTLDRYAEEADLERIDFLKIDVQGGELDVLAGARGILERDRPCIYMEWTHSYDSAAGRVEYGLDHRLRTAAMRRQLQSIGDIYRIQDGSFVRMTEQDWESFEGNVLVNPPRAWMG